MPLFGVVYRNKLCPYVSPDINQSAAGNKVITAVV